MTTSFGERENSYACCEKVGLITPIFVLLLVGVVYAASPFNVDGNGLAIKRYDPVAYFIMEKSVQGMGVYKYECHGAKWRFANGEHMKLFMRNPEKHAPQYGGYCAYGVAVGSPFDIKPEAWNVVDSRLYLNKNLDVRETWKKDIPGNIKKADMNWPGSMKK